MRAPNTAKNVSLTTLLWIIIVTPVSATLMDAVNTFSPGEQYRVILTSGTLSTVAPSATASYDSRALRAADAGFDAAAIGETRETVYSLSSADSELVSVVSGYDVTEVSMFSQAAQSLAAGGQDALRRAFYGARRSVQAGLRIAVPELALRTSAQSGNSSPDLISQTEPMYFASPQGKGALLLAACISIAVVFYAIKGFLL